jgi:hypothetical protein
MTTPESMADLSVQDRLQLGTTLAHLQREFAGRFDDETMEHCVVDSFTRLAATAKVREFSGCSRSAARRR